MHEVQQLHHILIALSVNSLMNVKTAKICNFRITRIMMTSANGNIFRVTGPLWGESCGPRWIPLIKANGTGFDVFFDLRLNKQFSKQSRRQWFETRSLWRQSNDN